MNYIRQNPILLSSSLREELERVKVTRGDSELEWGAQVSITRYITNGFIDRPRERARELMKVSDEVLDSMIKKITAATGTVVLFDVTGKFSEVSVIGSVFASMVHFCYGVGMESCNYADGVFGDENREYLSYLDRNNLVIHDFRFTDAFSNECFGHFLARRNRRKRPTFVTVRSGEKVAYRMEELGRSFMDIVENERLFLSL